MGEVLERKSTGRTLGHTEGFPIALITLDAFACFFTIDDTLVRAGKNAHFAAYTSVPIHPDDPCGVLCNGPGRAYMETGGLGALLTYERTKGSSFFKAGDMDPGRGESCPVTLAKATSHLTPFTAGALF